MTNTSKNGVRETAFGDAVRKLRELHAERANRPHMFLVEMGGNFLGEVSPLSNGRWMACPYGRSYPNGSIFDTADEAENFVREGA
ncbi:TPA: hypothetical protein JG930_004368 [Enterobacter hormaechei subsp. steigerwaltii]|nr:hypothetical protein [Enterobacter hormaechei subsp. steigerwaltii]